MHINPFLFCNLLSGVSHWRSAKPLLRPPLLHFQTPGKVFHIFLWIHRLCLSFFFSRSIDLFSADASVTHIPLCYTHAGYSSPRSLGLLWSITVCEDMFSSFYLTVGIFSFLRWAAVASHGWKPRLEYSRCWLWYSVSACYQNVYIFILLFFFFPVIKRTRMRRWRHLSTQTM